MGIEELLTIIMVVTVGTIFVVLLLNSEKEIVRTITVMIIIILVAIGLIYLFYDAMGGGIEVKRDNIIQHLFLEN